MKGYKEYIFKGYELTLDDNNNIKRSNEKSIFTTYVKKFSKRELLNAVMEYKLDPKTVEIFMDGIKQNDNK
jgi:hypothetical protein